MSDSYALDATLLMLLLITCWLCYLFHSGKIDEIDVSSTARQVKPHSRLYPAKLIRQAGLAVFRNTLLYWSLKTVLSAVAIVMLFDVANIATINRVFLSVLAFFLLDIWLIAKRKARQQKINQSLEFFISLMLVYLQSGNNLSQSFRLAAMYGLTRHNPLADELLLIASELDAGRERQRAFSDLALRTGVKNLEKLATIIQVGMNVGAPLINGLQSQLAAIRLQREELLTARINRKSLETMLPMLLVCFPMFLVLVFFPAAIQIMDVIALLAQML